MASRNIDRSLGGAHASVMVALRKTLVGGASMFDPETNLATGLNDVLSDSCIDRS